MAFHFLGFCIRSVWTKHNNFQRNPNWKPYQNSHFIRNNILMADRWLYLSQTHSRRNKLKKLIWIPKALKCNNRPNVFRLLKRVIENSRFEWVAHLIVGSKTELILSSLSLYKIRHRYGSTRIRESVTNLNNAQLFQVTSELNHSSDHWSITPTLV